ncbi:MAG: superoxide dismutase, Ni [Patescibacteria group bacterium]
MKLSKFIYKIYAPKIALAHCDIPCGIYTIEPAITAAKTVIKMTQKLKDLNPPKNNENKQEVLEFLTSVSRFTATKEEHAQKCKQELLILWTDFFKEHHLNMFPDLHNIFWKATKLCSKVKQEVSLENARELEKIVNEIAEIFHKANN